ncbi:MAG TPA: CD1871A family CXXC motif-containing protein [Spirochaetota bacterium]|nr:CD1871A family CXXC motif-containing protein [Spirochaetota bacterium]HOL56230.1 CD1871A family CXXC motif-containing protein [Spirochaetota bacterium]HPP04137.1 CD1871A family CXXC motif-containing protein [Spirochaetota bacterium]
MKIKIIILIISIFMIILGLIFGDIITGILQKALNICYECIGIG